MAGINKVILVGRLGRDPEVRHTNTGNIVVNFTVATSDTWTDRQTSEKKEKTEWHRVVAFQKLAELCGNYLSKGRQVYVEGSLQTREWADKDGNKRHTTEIVASTVQFLGDIANNKQPGASFSESDMPVSAGPTFSDSDDDIPF